MKKEEFAVLRSFVYEKAGIYFSDKKAYLLENRLKNRLHELNLSSLEDYYYYLRYGDGSKEELFNFYDVVTTNETSFFRNPPQLEMFKEILRAEHFGGRKQGEPLRVWSAGCSTGEEPYTLAIIILELMETLGESRPFAVYATDISKRALRSAERGSFNTYAMRHVGNHIRDKYFTRSRNSFAVEETLRRRVKFDFMNLNDDDAYRRFSHMDVILCRNVLIYFDEAMRKKVAEHMYAALKPGGYLLLGHSESLYPVSKLFKPVVLPGAVLYQRERAAE